ncbi:RNA pyrophosphohydrolase [Paremcibacter congregatus]|uniref:RNA pyrophosphohydrolase n=1 Tax=Paremcibacter congregatus TaxID=2043170 RepID=UPI0030EC500E
MTSELPYRPCVGIMLLNQDNKVFVAKRIDTLVEAWQMPQGGVDEGEDPASTAFREMEEEIGTRNAEIVDEYDGWLTYDLPDHLIGKVWKGKYRGQKMKWFVLRYKGADGDINIETTHPEFSEWCWLDMEKLPETIVAFKKPLYQKLVDRFGKWA